MKRFTFITGFLLLTSAVAIPLFYWRRSRKERELDVLYDTTDFLAEEAL